MANFESPVAQRKLQRTYDHLFKMILIGDANVGKTGLVLRFCEEYYDTSYSATIGIDFKLRTVEVDGKKIKLQIWDTAGQERFQTLTSVYYRGTLGAIFVYDVTRNKTFENIENWIKAFENSAGLNIPKILIGNKCDKDCEREVSNARAEDLAIKLDMRFCETSAKTGANVENAFLALTRDIIARKMYEAKRDTLESFGLKSKRTKNRIRRKKIWLKCALL